MVILANIFEIEKCWDRPCGSDRVCDSWSALFQNVVRKEGDSLIQEQDSVKGKIIITRAFTDAGMDMVRAESLRENPFGTPLFLWVNKMTHSKLVLYLTLKNI